MKVLPRRWLRYAVLSLSGWMLLFSPVPSSAKNDLDRFDLQGDVRTVVTKHPQLKTIHQFDLNGRLTALDLVPAIEADSIRYAYLYDADGRLLEEQTFAPDKSVAHHKAFRYALDQRGRPSAQVASTEEGQFAHAEFAFYDQRGWLAEEIMVTGQGVAEKSLYDARNNLIYHARYFEGRLILEAAHYYDPLDRLQESRFYGNDGSRMRRDHYRYDQAGNRIEQVSEYSRQSHLRKSIVTYGFDGAGNWVRETIQRWVSKGTSIALAETVVSRERVITYYEPH